MSHPIKLTEILRVPLPTLLCSRLRDAARDRGVSPVELVEQILDDWIARQLPLTDALSDEVRLREEER